MTDWNKEFIEAAKQALEKTESVIRKNGPANKPFCIYSKTGKNLGCYPTRKQAEKRLAQIHKFSSNKEIIK